MNQQIEILISFILYLIFFAWIGRSRGTLRELIVLVTAVLGWIGFNQDSVTGIFTRLINLISVALTFVRSGGLGANPEDAFGAIGSAPRWINAGNQDGFYYLMWVLVVILSYVISNRFVGNIGNSGWAMLLGITNGLFFTSVLLPRLVSILTQGINGVDISNIGDLIDNTSFFGLFRGIFGVILAGLGSLWGMIGSSQFWVVFLILVTLLILIAANTLRGQE